MLILGENNYIDTLIDQRDSRAYRIVKIQDQWWMSENLKYGILLDPKYNQTNNNVVEYYVCGENPDGIDPSTAVYGWHEAMDYQLISNKGICPDGWRIPGDEDWSALYNWLPGLTIKQRKDYLEGAVSGLSISDGLYFTKPNTIENETDLWMYFTRLDMYWSSSWHQIHDAFYAHFARPLSSRIEQNNGERINQYFKTIRCIKNE